MPLFRRTKPNRDEEPYRKPGRLHRVNRGLDEARERLKPRSDKGRELVRDRVRRLVRENMNVKKRRKR